MQNGLQKFVPEAFDLKAASADVGNLWTGKNAGKRRMSMSFPKQTAAQLWLSVFVESGKELNVRLATPIQLECGT